MAVEAEEGKDLSTVTGVLQRFWSIAERPTTRIVRLNWLRVFAEGNYDYALTVPEGHAKAMRREWVIIRTRRVFSLTNRWCWTCPDTRAQHWHHIVFLCRGGDNRKENLVPLCRDCHYYVHWGRERKHRA